MSLNRFLLPLPAALLAAAAGGMPAIGASRARVVVNQPGEILRPTPRKPDLEKIVAAERKRDRRNRQRLVARAAGGWVSSDAWLARLA